MQNTPILILHGWNLSASKFNSLKEEFDRRGYKSYCPDLPGFGNNQIPNKPLNLFDYVDFVEKFIQENKLSNVTIIGHSFGGRIGIKLAAQNPNLLHALILTGAPGIIPVPRSKALFFIILAKAGRKLFSLPIVNFFQNIARQLLYRTAGAMDYYNTDEKMRDTFKNIVRENLEVLLTQISTPTLLLWGKEDGFVPIGIAQKMEKMIKNSKLVVIENSRHGVPWTHPKEFADKVEDFLQRSD